MVVLLATVAMTALALGACTAGSRADPIRPGSATTTLAHPTSTSLPDAPTTTGTGIAPGATTPGTTTSGTSASRTTAHSGTSQTPGLPRESVVRTLTPQTPDGLATGPGVDSTSITLGVLVDPDMDRGFTEGLQLWQQTTNLAGGSCGRTIAFTVAGADGVPAKLPTAYRAIGRDVLGLITLPGPGDTSELTAMIGHDQIPALTTLGTSRQLAAPGPIVIGPTADVIAINAFAYLNTNKLLAGGTLGVLTDGSAAAIDALDGLRWVADRAGTNLDVRASDTANLTGWAGARAVISLTDPADTERLLAATVSDGTTVVTTIDGYDPAGMQPGWSHRLLIATPTPAYGSNHPAAAAIASAFVAAGGTDPGARLLPGYATGAAWGRLLDQACKDGSLTRSGIITALIEIGAAPADSVLGPADPALVVSKHLPATRLSAMAGADPSAPSGLTPLTWLEAAPNIADYAPTG